MKTKLLALALSTMSLVAMPALAESVTYTVDPDHAQIHFTYSHMGFSHITGTLNVSEGSVTYDPAKPANSSVSITAQMDSVNVGVPAMNDHLKAADFFDVANFPTATFKSTKVEAAGEGKLNLTGDLTIHGKTQPASFVVTVNKVGEHPMRKTPAAGFDATGTINRPDFGIETYTMVTGPEIKLDISFEAFVPKAETKAE